MRPIRLLVILALFAGGCTTTEEGSVEAPLVNSPPSNHAELSSEGLVATHQRPDGNRVVEGRGSGPDLGEVEVFEDAVVWVVGVPTEQGPKVAAMDAAGGLAIVADGGVLERRPSYLAAMAPPTAVPELESLVIVSPADASPLSSPLVLPSGELVYVDRSGDVVISADARQANRVAVDALSDGRVVVSDSGRLLVLAQGTERYGHAVLGDATEAGGFAVLEPDPWRATTTVVLEPPAVFEAVVPMWADVDGDGADEIVLTVSDPALGARIVVYESDGTVLAEGPPIGRGFRWRHLIAVGPFGPEGETEIAVVRTPHIGGVLEMYRLQDGGLAIDDSMTGPFGSHALGSRNLDMAVAGDFDGDGQTEIVLPSADRRSILGVVHRPDGLETAWSIDLSAPLTSNLTIVQSVDGGLRLVAGLGDGTVVEWSP